MAEEMQGSQSDEGSSPQEPKGDGRLIEQRLRLHAQGYVPHYPWEWAEDAAPLLVEAAREIEMLRTALARIADQNATFSVIGGNIIVDVEPMLTDAEREAIQMAISACKVEEDLNKACGGRQSFAGLWQDHGNALRSLLERTK